jgi:N4-gp56 family major capsid protein
MADMNITAARPGLTPTSWAKTFFSEYVRANPFAMYMGTSVSDMIQVREDLERKEGDSVVFPAVRRLVGAGVTGNQILEGNEELLNARSMKLTISYFRHAVAVSKWDAQKSIVDLLEAAKDGLTTWALEKMRADIILALGNITANGDVSVPFASATATQRNAWLANNADRVLVGSSKANASSNVMATALATINNTTGKVSGSTVSLAKRLAKTANPRIRPITVKNKANGTAEEWFTLFLNSLQFRDFRNDPAVLDAQKNALERGKDNPIFSGGDLLWDQVIVREVPELPVITGAGAGGIDVAAGYMCGAQALGVAWAQRSTPIQNVRDYGAMKGVGVEEMRGIDKLRFGRDPTDDKTTPIDQGIFTLFNASVADA